MIDPSPLATDAALAARLWDVSAAMVHLRAMIGQIALGHFRIVSRLGSGGMGVVYRAHDEKLQREIAIKVMGGESDRPDLDRLRIIEEARAASGLSHPNICTVYETGEFQGQAYIAMEYVEGRALSEMIPPGGLPAEAVIRYGIQIADALAHAHRRGVIHRDLKTSNVVVDGEGRAKVLDFGLARRIALKTGAALTRSGDLVADGKLVGTLAYMAPEMLLHQTADERSDIWGLGVMLYEMAAGEPPFKGRNEFEITAGILRSPADALPAHVPPMLRAIIQRCIAKEPGQRYQHAGEVRAALEAIQSDAIAPASTAHRSDAIAAPPRSAPVETRGGARGARDRRCRRGADRGRRRRRVLVPARHAIAVGARRERRSADAGRGVRHSARRSVGVVRRQDARLHRARQGRHQRPLRPPRRRRQSRAHHQRSRERRRAAFLPGR